MGKTHWKKLNNPDYLGAYALEPGEDMILTIKSAGEETYVGNAGKKETGLLIHFVEKEAKPMICNATNAKTITKVAGSPYVEDWKGAKIALFATEVNAFGDTVEALRVRPYTPKTEIYCDDCGAPIKAKYGKSPRQLAAYTKEQYGVELCADCATKRAEAKKAEEITDETGESVNEDNED